MNVENKPSPMAAFLQKPIFKRLVDLLFTPHPSISGVVERRRAQITILLSFAITVTNSIALLFVAPTGNSTSIYLQAILSVISILGYLASRTKRFIWGGIIVITSLSLSGYANVLGGTDNPSNALYLTLPIGVIIGSALLPIWGNLILVTSGIVGTMVLPLMYAPYTFRDAGTNAAFLFTSGLLLIVVQFYRNNVEQARLEEVQSINRELRELGGTLEKRVAERTTALEARTKALATSTEVSRRLSTILDRDKLVREVVEQLVTAFNYYYAHIYLFDEAKETLIMVGGSGEAGQTMLARKHTIEKGRGLGRAAETNTVVLVPDTSKEPGWLPNELLPDTRSEIAVPISIGNEVLGVFDVQQSTVNALTEQDADLMQSIANQVAIALQNANIYVKAQRRADRETIIGSIGLKIQSATTIEDALQVAVRELGHALKAERSIVQLNLQARDNGNN